MAQVEHLTCGFGELKFSDAPADVEARKFGGHGAVFKNVDAYGDVIEPGAFSQWLADVKSGKQEWPAMLSQHGGFGMTAEDLTPVGSWLELSEDGHGLQVDGQLADTARGRDLYTLMKMKPRPAMKGLSIGYYAREWEEGTKAGQPRRRLKRVDVVEISPVTFPANVKAKVTSVKSIEALSSVREFEEFFRANGMGKDQAVALIARFKSVLLGDPAGALGSLGDPAAIALVQTALKKRGLQPNT